MAQVQMRRRLNSMSDNSTPSSDISEGSETCEASHHDQDWQIESHNRNTKSLILDNLDLRLDSLSLETSGVSEVSDAERVQIESFFSGLETEVSAFKITIIFNEISEVDQGWKFPLHDMNEQKILFNFFVLL
jgi:hypothetical protein